MKESRSCASRAISATYGARAAIVVAIFCALATPSEAVQGRKAPADPNEIEIFALEAPRVRAMLERASSAEAGRGESVNSALAARLYCEAAGYGSLEAQYRLGRMLLAGRGMPRNVSMAATLFSIAADNGHQAARAMILLIGERDPQLPECLSAMQSEPVPPAARGSMARRSEIR